MYQAHAAFDCVPVFGTGWALASLMGVAVEGTLAQYQGAHAGVYGAMSGGWEELQVRAAAVPDALVESWHFTAASRAIVVTGGCMIELQRDTRVSNCSDVL